MKHILVTGATGGMGKAICESLVAKGYKVYGIDYRVGEEMKGVEFFECDVTDTASVEKVFENVKQQTGKLDGIIHTAGIYDMDSLIEMPEERFIRIFDINVFGVFRINKIFAPMLTKGSRIVITSSELAPLDPLPFNGIYGITKATLEKYAFSLRMNQKTSEKETSSKSLCANIFPHMIMNFAADLILKPKLKYVKMAKSA